MAYVSWSVVFGEQPSATKWNILGTNDSSFNDGTGIGNATITADKLSTGASSASVTTLQSTASTSYTDLATSGPAVTLTIGANGLALVCIGAVADNATGNQASIMGYAVSGATTVAATDATCGWMYSNTGGQVGGISRTYLHTGLTAGSNTFTAKYRATGGTGDFQQRTISVVPL